MTLSQKIYNSIAIIQNTEKMALRYKNYGFHLAFSGGKDSQVIYELAKMAGVKFQAYFYKTSVDDQELLQFIRDNYPDVIWIKPELTMYQLIYKKKALPTRVSRFCCEVIKERHGMNEVVIIGVRKSESNKRKKRQVFTSECKKGCDKNLLSPILEWTTRDVFSFLKSRNVQVSKLYERQPRIGCIGCPMSSRQAKELHTYPNFKLAYENTCQKIINDFPDSSFAGHFLDGKDAVKWWVSGMGLKKYKAMRDLQGKLEL